MDAFPAAAGDIVSISMDLDFVQKACAKLLADRRGNEAWVEKYALWLGAVVVYTRCFGSGKRTALPPSVLDGLSRAQLAVHKKTWRERDKAVAHMEIRREAVLAIERVARMSTNEIVGHQVQYKRYTHSLEEVGELKDLVEAIQPRAAALMDAALRKLHP